MVNQQYQAYSSAMQTMAGTRQVIMLYDGVLRALNQAREAMQEKRIEDRFHQLTHASEIIFGLQSCLDFENGGDIAKTLYQFYAGIDARLFTLHRTNDIAECNRLIEEVKQMRDVWVDIDKGDKKEHASEAADEEDASAPASSAAYASEKNDDKGGNGVAISA